MNALTEHLKAGGSLDREQVSKASEGLLDEGVAVDDKVAFLRSLHEKGESPEEIAFFVDAFLERAVVPPLEASELEGPMIDVCGTGGDGLNLFNVSTTSIFVLAAAGLSVVKHGNRGITSKSGGADVLEALGVPIDHGPEAFAEVVKAHGLGFLFAPKYHPAFKAVVPVRKILAEQGQKTIFNMLGPLLNPLSPDYQMIGVFDDELLLPYAQILIKLGRKEAWAVHGKTADGRGVDELSVMGPSMIFRSVDGELEETWTVTPDALGLPISPLEEVQGGDAVTNAGLLEGILTGEVTGPMRDMTQLNAAAGLAMTGKAKDLVEGIALAGELIDRGAALAKLRALQGVG